VSEGEALNNFCDFSRKNNAFLCIFRFCNIYINVTKYDVTFATKGDDYATEPDTLSSLDAG